MMHPQRTLLLVYQTLMLTVTPMPLKEFTWIHGMYTYTRDAYSAVVRNSIFYQSTRGIVIGIRVRQLAPGLAGREEEDREGKARKRLSYRRKEQNYFLNTYFLILSPPESIYKVPGDDTRFYGVFTTASTGLMGSAICIFTIADIQKAFEGKFKEQATSSSAWLPVISSKVPEPRPGTCVNDTASLPDTVLNFIRLVARILTPRGRKLKFFLNCI